MRWMLCASILAALSGCHAYYLDVDGRIAERAAQPIDVQATPVEMLPPPTKQASRAVSFGVPKAQSEAAPDRDLQFAAAQKEAAQPDKDKKYPQMMERLEFKKGILGFDTPDIKMPSPKNPEELAKAIKTQFPPLPALKPLPEAQVGPDGRPLTLADLQQIALRTNPLIRQAHLDIDASRGIALQAKLYPNPVIGLESTTIGQGRTPGQQGGFYEQTIPVMGKLALAHNAALRDVQIAEQKLKQAEADLQAQVRMGYFAVLSARENHRVTKALTDLTDELYNVLLLQLTVGEVAAYEPMQIRVLAWQSRGTLTQAQNRYVAAWKQLAATLGTPNMPLTALEGKIDMPVPYYERDKVLAFVLANHSDVLSALVGVEKNRFLARLAEVQPYPDVTVHVAVQKDYTTAPFGAVANVNVGVPFPLWNRNQGNIQSARSMLRRAMDERPRVENELSSKVADVFERYDNNRALLKLYRNDILPNQVQAFRAALARHTVVGGIPYNDVVTSQQALVTLINNYLGALNDQWTAVVDINHLLQSRDLFQTQPYDEVAPIPDVHELIRGGLRHRR